MVKDSWQRVANSVSHVSACVDSDNSDDDDDDDDQNNRDFKIQRRGRQREPQRNNSFD